MRIRLNRLFNGRCVIIIAGMMLALTIHAGNPQIQPFIKGSLERILDDYQGKPVMMVLWSIECSACLKELRQIGEFIKSNPDLNIIFVSTDAGVDFSEIDNAMTERGLPAVSKWAFADENTQALRYEIDPKWYGELPRTYFYDNNHRRIGLSGIIKHDHLAAWSTSTSTVPELKNN